MPIRSVWIVCLLGVILTLSGGGARAAVRLYPAPQNDESMRTHTVRVTVDGRESFTYGLMRNGVAYGGIPTVSAEITGFEFTDGAEVSVEILGVPVNFVRVRRLGADVPTRKVGNKIMFHIGLPGAYSVQANRDLRNRGPLVIFANAPEAWTARPGDIAFKPGTVTDIGVLRVKKNGQRIHIPGGAVVRGVIKIEGARNVTLSGAGILLFDDIAAADPRIAREDDTSPLLATDTKNLTVSGVTVVVAPTSFSSGPGGSPIAPWAVHIMRSTAVTLNSLSIFNGLRDGLDIDGSQQVTVRGGFVQAFDDALCIKSINYGADGGTQGRSVTDILFAGVMTSTMGAGGALQIGSELHADEIARITYRNIDILHALGLHSIAISIRNGDRASVHDITYENVRVLDWPGTLLRMSIETDGYKPDPARGTIGNITLRSIHVSADADAHSTITGIDPQHTVRDVRFQDFRIGGMPARPNIEIDKAPPPL